VTLTSVITSTISFLLQRHHLAEPFGPVRAGSEINSDDQPTFDLNNSTCTLK